MIKNVVFDLGQVLVEFNPLKFLNDRYNDVQKVDALYENIFKSDHWLELDRGTITKKGALDKFINNCPEFENEIIDCMESWHYLLKPIEKHVDVLKHIKGKGINTYILSNFHKLAYEDISQKYDFFTLFDGGVISYNINYLKPENEIYTELIKKYNIIPEETIFIDDSIQNIIAAKEIGFNVIHCSDEIDLFYEINKIL